MHYDEVQKHLPLRTMQGVVGRRAKFYDDWLNRRARQLGVHGVFILITRTPGRVRREGRRDGAAHGRTVVRRRDDGAP